jgi:hypothetical protein
MEQLKTMGFCGSGCGLEYLWMWVVWTHQQLFWVSEFLCPSWWLQQLCTNLHILKVASMNFWLYESSGCLSDCMYRRWFQCGDCYLMKICNWKSGKWNLLRGGCFAGEVATARAISAADTIMVFAQIPLLAAIYALTPDASLVASLCILDTCTDQFCVCSHHQNLNCIWSEHSEDWLLRILLWIWSSSEYGEFLGRYIFSWKSNASSSRHAIMQFLDGFVYITL